MAPQKKTAEKRERSFDMSKLKERIERNMSAEKRKAQTNKTHQKSGREYFFTGIKGFDSLLTNGIPKGSSVLIAGGAGSGKTLFCLQTLAHHALNGKKCLYMSFEESEERLIEHMEDFNWRPQELIKEGKLRIKRYSPFDVSRGAEAMLAKEKGELLFSMDVILFPEGFKPDFVIVDSVTAVASAFAHKGDSYRIYINQLFRFFEDRGITVFLISETKQNPDVFSTTGVEEFLADGVIVLHNERRGGVREVGIEVLKMRGEKHEKKIVAMQIDESGIVVYPDQEVFGSQK